LYFNYSPTLIKHNKL